MIPCPLRLYLSDALRDPRPRHLELAGAGDHALGFAVGARPGRERSGDAVVAEYNFVAAIFFVAAVFPALAVLCRDFFQRNDLHLNALLRVVLGDLWNWRSVLVRASRSLRATQLAVG